MNTSRRNITARLRDAARRRWARRPPPQPPAAEPDPPAAEPDPLAALLEQAAATPPAETTFDGWGMRTDRALPWDDGYQWTSLRESLDALRSFDLGPVMRIMVPDIDMLRWRHWVVAFTVRYVERMAVHSDQMVLAECGVGDGMSAFVALRELRDIAEHRPSFASELHLYDSFAAMRDSDLTATELVNPVYESLSLDRTQRNLAEFSSSLVWHMGYIPDTFEEPPPSPVTLDWLHIDLNSARPTLDACAYFLPRLNPRGVILFDDYGDQKWVETKHGVDQFFADAPGLLLKFPTGQAVYLHNGDTTRDTG